MDFEEIVYKHYAIGCHYRLAFLVLQWVITSWQRHELLRWEQEQCHFQNKVNIETKFQRLKIYTKY
jgi:hypothetical protein